jgi:hypothetical protein
MSSRQAVKKQFVEFLELWEVVSRKCVAVRIADAAGEHWMWRSAGFASRCDG